MTAANRSAGLRPFPSWRRHDLALDVFRVAPVESLGDASGDAGDGIAATADGYRHADGVSKLSDSSLIFAPLVKLRIILVVDCW